MSPKANTSPVTLLSFFAWRKVSTISNSTFSRGSSSPNTEPVKESIGLMCVLCSTIGPDRLSTSAEDLSMVGSGASAWT
ncbi:Uncharacterised protein [Vibrio cholerae]|nr:Uncharacterised protein [Vibrio cholerae]